MPKQVLHTKPKQVLHTIPDYREIQVAQHFGAGSYILDGRRQPLLDWLIDEFLYYPELMEAVYRHLRRQPLTTIDASDIATFIMDVGPNLIFELAPQPEFTPAA